MTVPNSPAALKLAMNPVAARRLYNTLAVLGYLMGIVAPGSEWQRQLADLIKFLSLGRYEGDELPGKLEGKKITAG